MTILTYVWQNIWVNLTKILSQNLDKGSQLWVYFIAEPLRNIWSWCWVLRGVASVGLLVPLGDGVNGLGAEALPQRSVLVLRQGRWCRRGEGGWELARRVRGGLEGGALGAGVVIGLLLVHGDTRPHTREESHLLPGRMKLWKWTSMTITEIWNHCLRISQYNISTLSLTWMIEHPAGPLSFCFFAVCKFLLRFSSKVFPCVSPLMFFGQIFPPTASNRKLDIYTKWNI